MFLSQHAKANEDITNPSSEDQVLSSYIYVLSVSLRLSDLGEKMRASVSFKLDYQAGRTFVQGESLGGLGVAESLKSMAVIWD